MSVSLGYDWDLKKGLQGTEEGEHYEQYFVKREEIGSRKTGVKIGDIEVTEPVYEDVYMKLETVRRWEKGNLAKEATCWAIPFSASRAPWVINCGYTPKEFSILDPIGSKVTFSVAVFSEADYEMLAQDQFLKLVKYKGEYRGASSEGIHCIVVQDMGDYIIEINATNIVSWWVKVGVE